MAVSVLFVQEERIDAHNSGELKEYYSASDRAGRGEYYCPTGACALY